MGDRGRYLKNNFFKRKWRQKRALKSTNANGKHACGGEQPIDSATAPVSERSLFLERACYKIKMFMIIVRFDNINYNIKIIKI